MITEQQKKVIRENPNLSSEKLSSLIGLTWWRIRNFRREEPVLRFYYSGIGVPFMFFSPHCCAWVVRIKSVEVLQTSKLSKAIEVVDHIIWCLENNMFNQPRIENPYFKDLNFIK